MEEKYAASAAPGPGALDGESWTQEAGWPVWVFPHDQSLEAFQAQVDACLAHDTADRLVQITAPTLVVAGDRKPQ